MIEGPRTSTNARPGFLAAIGFGAVILITAGVVAPISGGADEARRAEARRQAAVVGSALREFLRDCAVEMHERLPEAPGRLYGPGVQPDVGALASLAGFPLSGVLCRDDLGLGAAWKGPYLDGVPIDPWGRAWIVRLPRTAAEGDLWVLSAAEDGVLETASSDDVSPQDVGVRLLR